LERPEEYKKYIFIAIIVIALGTTFSTTIKSSLGIVLVAIGGLLFIIGMKKKRDAEETNKEDE